MDNHLLLRYHKLHNQNAIRYTGSLSMRKITIFLALGALFLTTIGCTVSVIGKVFSLRGLSPAPVAGNIQQGEHLFKKGKNKAPPCLTCHPLQPGGFALGPSLKGIYERASNRVPGQTAESYLHQSIIAPMTFIVPGYRPIMYPDYEKDLSEQDIADLIAYLRTF
ncbi:MAG: c-type cytochrome [Anaerolineae bacterium]|nr:c-type cytochrome [Anaerolineae bacterium]